MIEIKFRLRLKELTKKGYMEWFEYYTIGELISGGAITTAQILSIDLYTGLKDKNGKEIYEGDIVELAHTEQSGSRISNLVVEYLVDMSGFYLMKNGDGCHLSHSQTILNGRLKHIEINGNIYENPELVNDVQ